MHDENALHVLRDIAAGFDSHDMARLLLHFAPDAVFESPRGPERWGQRFEGLDAIRGAFAARFDTIPDVRYRDDSHFVAGGRGASEWTLTGTTIEGAKLTCEAATCGRSATVSSSKRTRTGRCARGRSGSSGGREWVSG